MSKLNTKSLFLAISGLVLAITLCVAASVFADTAWDIAAYTPANCNQANMTVVDLTPTSALWPNRAGNTIYVLDSWNYQLASTINLGSCAAIVGSGIVTLYSNTGVDPMISLHNAQNVIISNINLQGGFLSPYYSDYGIAIGNGTNITLDTLDIQRLNVDALYVSNVTGSSFSNITLHDASNAWLELIYSNDNILTNVSSYNNNHGILIQSGSTNTFTNASVYSNPAGIGISIDNSMNATFNGGYISWCDYGIRMRNSASNTIIDNVKVNNNNYGVLANTNAGSMQIQNGTEIFNNNWDAIYLWHTTGNVITNANIHNNVGVGILLQTASNNTISNNQITANSNGITLWSTSNANTISSNTISNNVHRQIHMSIAYNNVLTSNTLAGGDYGISLDTNANSNTITNTYQSNTTGNGLYMNAASGNVINGGNFNGNLNGISLNGASNNTFSTTQLIGNTYGMLINNSSNNNTINLENNTNGIYLNNSSDKNNIMNTQIVGQNNISFYDTVSNTIINGWLVSATTTNTGNITIALKNDELSPVYTISGAWVSQIYTGTMTSPTMNVTIVLTAGDGAKPIIITYNNGNKQYDTITLQTTVTPPWGGGGGWGWGGGWGGWISTTTTGASTGTTYGTGAIGSIVGSHYSTEMNNAYLRSFSLGITTQPTIQLADIEWTLIRAHLAKMISAFAIKVAGLVPDTGASCNFADVWNQTAEMKLYIKLSCQLWLMGVGITDFDPNGVVTRAQFGTVLSRLIRGTAYNNGTPYYSMHLWALKNAGIMTQISTPYNPELRGFVMIMLKRAYDQGFVN